MVSTIPQALEELLSRLTPTSTESEAAANHRNSISECLQSTFGITNFFRTGSFGYGTSIRGFSDIDYFAVLPSKSVGLSNGRQFLDIVRATLEERFPLTHIYIDPPAVALDFGDGDERVEITPAVETGKSLAGNRAFRIPNNQNDGWMRSSPEDHRIWLNTRDEKIFRGRLRPLIRLIKAWKYWQSVRIRSFYLEAFVATVGAVPIGAEIDVMLVAALEKLRDTAPIQFTHHMTGNGDLSASQTPLEFRLAKDDLMSASIHARRGVQLREREMGYAFDCWKRVYGENFPSLS